MRPLLSERNDGHTAAEVIDTGGVSYGPVPG
jgi:hypothetical protein